VPEISTLPLRRRGLQAQRHPNRRARDLQSRAVAEDRRGRFERLVERALDVLPAGAKRLLENVAIVIEATPTAEQLAENGLGPGDTLFGLYEGTPAVEWGADSVPFPNKITLFQGPLEREFADPAELAAEVRRTVLHELAHHAGFDDERLQSLDLD
jgi:predicted Zn-dependent protease with MMP-like domain